MPLIINSDGKLEEVVYSSFEKLMLALKNLQKRHQKTVDTLTAEIAELKRHK